jgi:hypothetical protein
MRPWMIPAIVLLLAVALPGYGGGASEGAASSTRGEYLAGKGIIIPPKDIYPDSYIAQIDYDR